MVEAVVGAVAATVLALTCLATAPARAGTAPGAPPVCPAPASPAATRIGRAFAAVRFVTYTPLSLRLGASGHIVSDASAAGLRADLERLRPYFDGLVTYTPIHGLEALPEVAAALGFRALIIGVWNPLDAGELGAALTQSRAHPELVAGIGLGNEILFDHRASAAQLAAILARVRREAPQLALALSEPFHVYAEPEVAALRGELDFLLPTVHPLFQPWFRPEDTAGAARFVVNVVNLLHQDFCGPVLVKETGLPAGPAERGFDPARQAAFWRTLRGSLPPSQRSAFAWFAAFDAPWRGTQPDARGRVHPEEGLWGLWDAGREPRDTVRELPRLAPPLGAPGTPTAQRRR